MKKNNCAFNYTGSKLKFYDKIQHLFPEQEDVSCLDLFTGGGSLASRLPEDWSITANDACTELIHLHQKLSSVLRVKTPVEIVEFIKSNAWVKGNKDKEGYELLKHNYNNYFSGSDRDIMFYELICSSFSNQIRFNKEGYFNLPFGKRYFNPSMQKKMEAYLEHINERDINFTSCDFRDYDLSEYDFVIIDSPYLNTCAGYNENGGWVQKDTEDLLEMVDKYAEQGGKFILFEEVLSKGTPNNIIAEWMKKYSHINLGDESKGCNYQRKDGITLEVCIYN